MMLIEQEFFTKSKVNTFATWKERLDKLAMFDKLAGLEESEYASIKQSYFLNSLSNIYGENVVDEFKLKFGIR